MLLADPSSNKSDEICSQTNDLNHFSKFSEYGGNIPVLSNPILNESSNPQVNSNIKNENHQDVATDLTSYRVKNVGEIIIATLNINSIRNKFEELKMLISGNIDVLVVTETKLDDSFPTGQFFIEGFSALTG